MGMYEPVDEPEPLTTREIAIQLCNAVGNWMPESIRDIPSQRLGSIAVAMFVEDPTRERWLLQLRDHSRLTADIDRVLMSLRSTHPEFWAEPACQRVCRHIMAARPPRNV